MAACNELVMSTTIEFTYDTRSCSYRALAVVVVFFAESTLRLAEIKWTSFRLKDALCRPTNVAFF
jgi:hypothetical protein